ncbi:hypothetical protein PV08_07318 [Exophiala spinifera]|uniref:Uncharacterized protein n=1 Tax=Exophiala spinifera TaxID=91928 RepID=A0A0D2BTI7_9EURO|nr:uncharacterized protein PV08_07318 [Exophiala spinifera]KIW14534.1 hypothetical protein PV08_07318 [Exophiala spinifera]
MAAPTKLRKRDEKRNPTDTLEKDEVELRLEKALFGDNAGFLSSLAAAKPRQEEGALVPAYDESDDEDARLEDEQDDLNDVADEDLFFLDAGTGELPISVAKELEHTEPLHASPHVQPTWYDSDDDRITVSLASNTRLRKLRDTEADDVVSGREYIRRLRRQYESLHPTPDWVKYARKKRKLSTQDDEDKDTDSDVSMDEGGDSLPSARPLSELLRSVGSLTSAANKLSQDRQGSRKLRPEIISIQRRKDVAASGPSSIDSLHFHPYYPLLLAAGPSSTATIYHISPHPPNPNPILTSLHIKGNPLHTAAFCRPSTSAAAVPDTEHDQTRIFLSSRRRYFHTWSLSTGVVKKVTRALYGDTRKEQKTMESFKISPCGRYMGLVGSSRKGGGSINVLSTETMQWVCSCRVDSRGGIADFAWWSNGNGFAVVGKNGEVSEYDIDSRRVVARWIAEGAVDTTVIALSGQTSGRECRGGSRWVAIGSSSGVVDLYDRRGWTTETETGEAGGVAVPADERPKAARVLDQLVTPISHLVFSDDSQMLVMGSRLKKNAFRLVHLPSCTVYRNWPTEKTLLGRVSAVALSPGRKYLAVGNDQGRIKLWEINE